MKIRSILLLSLFCVRFEVFSQNRIGTGKVHELYEQLCASCHGAELEGGLGNSLLDKSTWNEVGKTTNFLDYVKAGNLDKGMPAFGEALSDPQIRSLEIYIDEVAQQKEREGIAEELPVDGLYQAAGYNFKVETVVEDLELPWSIAFMPDGGKLITERAGQLRYSKDGALSTIEGTPEVWQHGQGGLLEVALHPDFDQNGWIYLAFSHSSGKEKKKKVGMTKVVRGRVSRGQWIDEETIFEVPLEMQISTGAHFGTRLVFQDGYLFFGIGDRGRQPMVQDLSRPNGKIHRIHDDGRIPEDNPF
ncbi:MAG: PQQ-dependent sugar dehydrogenase, partial [Verrucomicrobiota bacterium]